jgi:hypothetical protein
MGLVLVLGQYVTLSRSVSDSESETIIIPVDVQYSCAPDAGYL